MALGKNLTKPKENKPPDQVSQLDSPENQEEVDSSAEESNEEKEVVDSQILHQFCVFKAGKEEYAVSIDLVKEVVPYPSVAPVPQMPDYILGMSNVRGNIYGILDIAGFFKVEKDVDPRFLLVLKTNEYQMGIAIPDVPDSLMISDEMIESLSTSRLKSTIGQKYLKGIIKKDRRMIILFDILGMISSDNFTVRS